MSAIVEAVDCQEACIHGPRGSREEGMFIRCHVVDNSQAWNRQVVGAPGPVHAQGFRKQGKSRRWVQRGVWCSSRFFLRTLSFARFSSLLC